MIVLSLLPLSALLVLCFIGWTLRKHDANSGFIGSDYVGTVTASTGYEIGLGESLVTISRRSSSSVLWWWNQETELSGKVGITADVTDKLVSTVTSFITNDDDAGYGSSRCEV